MNQNSDSSGSSAGDTGSSAGTSDSISFQLTRDHMLEAHHHIRRRLAYRYRRSRLFQVGCWALMLAVAFALASLGKLYGVLEGADARKWFDWVMGSLLVSVAAIILISFSAIQIGKQIAIAAVPGVCLNCSVKVGHDGLHVKADDGEMRVNWSNVSVIDLDSDNLFVVMVNEQCLIIPRQAFQSAFEAERFVLRVRELVRVT